MGGVKITHDRAIYLAVTRVPPGGRSMIVLAEAIAGVQSLRFPCRALLRRLPVISTATLAWSGSVLLPNVREKKTPIRASSRNPTLIRRSPHHILHIPPVVRGSSRVMKTPGWCGVATTSTPILEEERFNQSPALVNCIVIPVPKPFRQGIS